MPQGEAERSIWDGPDGGEEAAASSREAGDGQRLKAAPPTDEGRRRGLRNWAGEGV
jgi:hypothetical protein